MRVWGILIILLSLLFVGYTAVAYTQSETHLLGKETVFTMGGLLRNYTFFFIPFIVASIFLFYYQFGLTRGYLYSVGYFIAAISIYWIGDLYIYPPFHSGYGADSLDVLLYGFLALLYLVGGAITVTIIKSATKSKNK